MNSLQQRRIGNIVLWLIIVAGLLLLDQLYRISLYSHDFVLGWGLAGLILFLLLFNLRKKLPFLPLGNASSWLQWHVYTGALALLLFFLHIDWRLPNGWLEMLLGGSFMLVSLSGLLGIYLSRLIPKRLSQSGESVIYERIPFLIYASKRQTEALVERSLQETQSTTLVNFFQKTLLPFFSETRNFWFHVVESRAPLNQLHAEMDALERYMNASEQAILQEIRALVDYKYELDYQYAGQTVLKYWLFVHVPLSYVLLLLVLLHGLLVYAFIGG